MKIRRSVLFIIPLLLFHLTLGPRLARATTFTVSGTTGDTSAGTLGAAVSQAAVSATANDAVSFTIASGQTITQSLNYAAVTKTTGSLSITGNNDTVSGGAFSTFGFLGGGAFSVSNLNLSGGFVTLGANTTLTLSNLSFNATLNSNPTGTLATSGSVSLTLNGSYGNLILNSGSAATLGGNSSTTGAWAINGTGGLNLNGFNLTVGGLSGTGTLTNSSATAAGVTVTTANAVTYGGILSGNLGLAMNGPGTLTLGAADTYSGNTYLQAGTLGLSNNTALSTGSLAMAGGTTLQDASGDLTVSNNISLGGTDTVDTNGNNLTLGGVLSGAGGLNKAGAGTLTLTNNLNSYTGATTLTAGTLSISSDSQLGAAGTNLVFNGGTLATTATISNSRPILLGAGGGTFSLSSGATDTFSGNISGPGSMAVTGAGTLVLTGASLGTGNISTLNGGVTLDLDNSASLTYTGALSGQFEKSGATTLTLSGNNGGLFGILIDGGTVVVASNNSLGFGAQLQGGNLDITASGSYNSFLSVIGTQTLDIASPQAVTLTGGLSDTAGSTLNLVGGGTLILSSAVTDSFNGTTSVGSGTTLGLGLTPPSTHGFQLQGGTLSILGSGAGAQTILLGALNVASDSTVNTASQKTGDLLSGLSGSGNLDLTGSGSLALDCPLTGFTGSITVESGTTLDAGIGGSNSGSGQWVLRGGTLSMTNSAGGTYANPITLSAGSSITVGASDISTLGGTISGAAGNNLDLSGTGTLLFGGSNTYQGQTTVESGTTLGLSNAGALGGGGQVNLKGGALSITTNATFVNNLNLGAASSIALSGNTAVWNGTISGGSLNNLGLNGFGTLTLGGPNTYQGQTSIIGSFVTLNIANAGALGGGGQVNLNGGTLGFTASPTLSNNFVLNAPSTINVASGQTAALNGVVSGSASSYGLNLAGSGTLVLGGSNTYQGATTIGSSATLDLANSGALGGGGQVLLNGTLGFAVSSTFSNNLILGGFPSSLQVASGQAATLSGLVSGSGSLQLTGPGTLVLSNASNSFGGFTNIEAGTLSIGSNGALGNTGGVLTLDGGTLATTASLSSSRSVSIGPNGGTLDTAAGTTFTFSGPVSGTGSLTKADSGTLVLSGSSNYSGGTTLSGGSLVVGNSFALGTGTLNLAGGTLSSNGSLSLFSNINQTADSTIGGTNNLSLGAVNLGSHNLSISNTAGAVTLGGPVSGTGTITENGAGGTLVLAWGNSYSGGTSLLSGTLGLANNNALGTGLLYMAAGVTLQSDLNNLAVSNALVLNGTDYFNLNGNTSTLSGTITGTGTLQETGTGILTLTGANNSTGGTSVNGGTLNVASGAALGSGAVNLTNGILAAGAPSVAVTNTLNLAGADGVNTNGGRMALWGPVAGSGSLAVTGGGVFLLMGSNTYSGGTSLLAGTLALGNDKALGTGALALSGGTTLQAGVSNLAVTNTIALNGAGSFDANGFNAGFSGPLTGLGSLSVTDSVGGGVLALSGHNTYSGGTSLQAGTLNLGNNNALGTGLLALSYGTTVQSGAANLAVANAVALNGPGTFDENGNHSGLSGVLTGLGSLSVTDSLGGGVLALSGDNTYSGGTSLQAGTLNVAGNHALGTGWVILSGGTTLQSGMNFVTIGNNLALNGSDSFDTNGNSSILSGAVTGSGSLVETGGGKLILAGANTYSGGTSVAAGQLNLANDNALGTGGVTMGNGSILQAGVANLAVTNAVVLNGGVTLDNFGYNAVFSGVFSGTGSLLVADNAPGGEVTLAGGNTYTGGTDVGANVNLGNNNALGKGAVTLEDGSMLQAGAANLAVTNTLVLNGFETFDADGNHCLLSGVISGGGNLVVSDSLGGGSLTLSGNNSFTGGVEVQTTTLDLGGNGALGTGSLKLDAGATLRAGINSLVVTNTVDLAGNATYDLNGIDSLLSGAITGAGSLNLTGSGNVTLSGNNTYSGGTTLSSGGLWVSNPAALGQGSVVNTGGTLAAAGGPTTLQVALDYTQGASGSLRMGLGGTAAGQYDVLSIGGAATLNGNLTVFSYNGFKVAQAQVFEIVDSTGPLSGEFSSFTDNAAGLGLTIVYGSNYVLLESLTQAFALAAATPNQVSVGVALDNTLDGSPFSPLSQALKSLGSASQQQAAMDQVSPASLTPMFQMGFNSAQARAQLVGSHLSQLFGSAAFNSNDYSWANQGVEFAGALDAGEEASLAQSATPGRWNAFVAGIGSFGTVGSDGNAGGYQYSVGGTAEGLEYRFGKDFVGGLLMGYSQSGTRQSTGTVNVSGGQVGLYVGVKQGDLNLEALVEGGLNNYSTQREGFGGTAVGSTQGQEYSGQLGGGYDFHMDGAVFGPLASVQTTRINVNGFTETGSLAPLTFGAQGETSIAGDLGAQASRRFNLDGLVLSPALNLAWEHIYQGNEDALAAGLGSGANFTVNGPATGTDAAVLGVGVRAEFAKGLSATVGYQGKLGLAHYDSQSFAGGVNIGF